MKEFIIENGVLLRYLGKKKILSIPSCVHTIGRYAFGGCETLEKVTVSDGITAIGEGAFMKCWYLKEIIIPESVREFDSSAFFAYAPYEIVFKGDFPTLGGKKDFYGTPTIYYDPQAEGWENCPWKESYTVMPLK